MKRFIYLLITIGTTLLSACTGGIDVNDTVTRAEIAMHDGEYRTALDLCHDIATTADTTKLYATQCCRMAVIYALAADNDVDRDESLANASHWFAKAYSINTDSTTTFLEGLTNEQAAAAAIAVQLLRTDASDLSNFTDPEDPTVLIDHDIDPDIDPDADGHEAH